MYHIYSATALVHCIIEGIRLGGRLSYHRALPNTQRSPQTSAAIFALHPRGYGPMTVMILAILNSK